MLDLGSDEAVISNVPAGRKARRPVLPLAAMAWGVGINVTAGFLANVLIFSLGEILVGATLRALTVRATPEHLRGRYLGLNQMS